MSRQRSQPVTTLLIGIASMFVGPDCSVCKDAGWTVQQKDFDVAP